MSATILIHGYLHPVDTPNLPDGFVILEQNQITEIGPMDRFPSSLRSQAQDLQGAHVCPGLIDAHCHLGLLGSGVGFEAEDCNEDTDPVTPQLRALDAINPLDRYFSDARSAGVTTVLVVPGSANAVCGQGAILKTAGRWVDEMVVQAPACMKFALGEYPNFTYRDRKEGPVTRMATAALIREALFKTAEYRDRQQQHLEDPDTDAPDFDVKWEALLPVLDGTLPAHFHAHRADDIATALRISKEFGLRPVIVHATEGDQIPELLQQADAPCLTGPILSDRSKPELTGLSLHTPAVLSRYVDTAICTDHPEVPIQYLSVCAALAVRGGMEEDAALAAITLTPARILGIDRRVGSLTPGKDADLAIFPAHPLDWRCQGPSAVYINGQNISEVEKR